VSGHFLGRRLAVKRRNLIWPDASAQHQQRVRMFARVRRSMASSPRGASEDDEEEEDERKVTRLEELQRLQANLILKSP
jgi:hypothetical protein